jgi:hypothetical protein
MLLTHALPEFSESANARQVGLKIVQSVAPSKTIGGTLAAPAVDQPPRTA